MSSDLTISPEVRNNIFIFNEFIYFLSTFRVKIADTISSLTAYPNDTISLNNYQDFPSQLIAVMTDFYNQHDKDGDNAELFSNLMAMHMGFD